MERQYFIGNGLKLTNPQYITDLPTDKKVALCGKTDYCSVVSDFTKARFFEDIVEVFNLYNKQPAWFRETYRVCFAEYNCFGHLVFIKVTPGITDRIERLKTIMSDIKEQQNNTILQAK